MKETNKTVSAETMNKAEAKSLLSQELSGYRELPYAQLFALIDHSETLERRVPSGTVYQIEMQVFVDDVSRQTLLVMGLLMPEAGALLLRCVTILFWLPTAPSSVND